MNTAKIYHDSEGNECSIFQVVRREPDWAATRIQVGERAIKREKELLAIIGELELKIESAVLDNAGFDYRCVNCSHQYNVELGVSEDCPKCGCDK